MLRKICKSLIVRHLKSPPSSSRNCYNKYIGPREFWEISAERRKFLFRVSLELRRLEINAENRKKGAVSNLRSLPNLFRN